MEQVLDEARKATSKRLKAVGHTPEADKHPVCQKLLAYIGPWQEGRRDPRQLRRAAYGWPRDAIDGALYALLAAGHIRKAFDAASKPVDAKSLDRAKLTQASFQREREHHAAAADQDPLAVQCRRSALPAQEELTKLPALLAKLRDQASKAGGRAPAPETPKLVIEAIEAQSGNAQLLELFTRYDEIVGLSKAWTQTANDIAKRLPVWRQLNQLLHAKALGPYAAIKAEVDAIEAQRSLLAEPDPVRRCWTRRLTCCARRSMPSWRVSKQTHPSSKPNSSRDADWNKLSDSQRDELSAQHNLSALTQVTWERPMSCKMLWTNATWTTGWRRPRPCPAASEAARHAAVQLLKPNVVHVALPKRTLNDEAELKAWLAGGTLLNAKLKQGPVAL